MMRTQDVVKIISALLHLVYGSKDTDSIKMPCVCGPPPSIIRGTYTLSNDHHCGSFAIYVCTRDNWFPEKSSLTCKKGIWGDGKVTKIRCRTKTSSNYSTQGPGTRLNDRPPASTPMPEPKQCGKKCRVPKPPANGCDCFGGACNGRGCRPNAQSKKGPTCRNKIRFSCKVKYYPLHGKETTTVTCRKGSWDKDPPYCMPYDCDVHKNDCNQGGRCIHDGEYSGFRCRCPKGTSGAFCEYGEVNICDGYTCENGKCKVNKRGRPICKCNKTFQGECQLKTKQLA